MGRSAYTTDDVHQSAEANTDLDRACFTLSPAELEKTRAKIDKINSRALKRGFTGHIVLDVQGPRTVSDTAASGVPVERVVYDVTVTGQAPCYNGWRLLALLDWDDEAGLITRCAPGVDTIDRTGLREGWCDHCETRRNRSKVYLVSNDAGEQLQVGSTCLKDFLGHRGSVVFYSKNDVGDQVFGDFLRAGRVPAYSTNTVLGVAWACIKTFGWVPAASPVYDVPTRDRVTVILDPRTAADCQIADDIAPLIAEMADKAAEVRAFIASDDFHGTSEYVANLKAVNAADYVTDRNFGLLVSAPQAWTRHQEQSLQRSAHQSATRNSVHVGEIGATIEQELTLTAIRYISGIYGTTTLYTFTDATGNIFKWFASNDTLADREGDTIPIRGTVKAHDEFHGAKETVLTRCKIVTVADRLGKQLVTANTDAQGYTARDVLRRNPQEWTTKHGSDGYVRVIDWLAEFLESSAGLLDTTQRVWNQYGEACDLHITRTNTGKVHAELRASADNAD